MSNKRQSNFTNLYVKNFGKDIDESKLCQLFSVYGTITSCKIQTDNNGQSKGFGFVNFERPEMAKIALEKLNGYCLSDGKNLYVAPFQKKSERQNELRRMQEENLIQRSNNLCLYISNLDIMIDEKILEAVFTRFGRVTKTHILRNGYQSKGIGFVCFNTMEETMSALNEMNGKWILSKPIYVRLSKNIDNLPSPSILPSQITTSAAIPTPYLNTPTMFYMPTIMVPPNVQMPIFRPYSLPLPPPPPPPTAAITHRQRSAYPYNRVKSDDQ